MRAAQHNNTTAGRWNNQQAIHQAWTLTRPFSTITGWNGERLRAACDNLDERIIDVRGGAGGPDPCGDLHRHPGMRRRLTGGKKQKQCFCCR